MFALHHSYVIMSTETATVASVLNLYYVSLNLFINLIRRSLPNILIIVMFDVYSAS